MISDTNRMLQNAAFCLGILAEHGGEDVAIEALKMQPSLLGLVRSRDSSVGESARDNAVPPCGGLMPCSDSVRLSRLVLGR